jgi:hypothetical protein
MAHVQTLCFNQKLEWLTFKYFVSTRNCSGSCSNTMLQPETEVAHVATPFLTQKRQWLMLKHCFKQKLQWLMFKHLLQPDNAVAHVPTICFYHKRQWLGSHSSTLFQPETAVAHITELCFSQKLQCLMFQNFASAKNCSGSYSKVVCQYIAGFDI